MPTRPVLVAATLVLAGCLTRVEAPEIRREEIEARREAIGPEAIDAYRILKGRLLEVEHRLRIANAALCGPLVVPTAGVLMADEDTFSTQDIRNIAARTLKLGERATVVYALPSGAFTRAGGRVGDALADTDQRSLTEILMEQVATARTAASGPIRFPAVSLKLIRDGRLLELQIQPDAACAVRAAFSTQDMLLPWQHDAFTSAIPAGALRELDDDELAVLIGHQIAHALIDLAQSEPDDREAIADRISVFMAARARFDYAIAPRLWERIAAEYPGAIEGWDESHGEIARRMPAIRATVAEIRSAAASGKPLHPGTF